MASRSQRRKEKHKRKRQEKKDQQRKRQENTLGGPIRRRDDRLPEIPLASNARQRQRLAEQNPQAWASELPEDAAIFDGAAFAGLSPEAAQLATAVREALQLACDSRGAEANERVSVIPRSSLFSDWRLLIRGLVAWLENDLAAAGEAFKRLNPDRRPGRIAAVMMNAVRNDLEQAGNAEVREAPAQPSAGVDWSARLDGSLLYHAKLLRRVRIDRLALRAAESGLSFPEEVPDLSIGSRKLRWVKRFCDEYSSTEPELCDAVSRTALNLAFNQKFVDVFEEAAAAIPGPAHDPKNWLRRFFYYTRFDRDGIPDKDAERSLTRYLTVELPRLTSLSDSLRGAIASEIHRSKAVRAQRPPQISFFGRMMGPAEDADEIRQQLEASIRAYPGNQAAHKTYADWVLSKLDDDNLRQAETDVLESDLCEIMEAWSENIADDVEPRLWLVDYLLEHERLDDAKPHVDWLASARQDDPRVRATPWKWQLLEAMRLCRRKAWLSEVPARLSEAEKRWPTWLSQQWLPYFHAALALRGGDRAAYEALRAEIWASSGVSADSLLDACMMLSAAQLMRVPPNDLKPLRSPVDAGLKKLSKVKDQDLYGICSFFWDLHRIQMRYPSSRIHGGKVAAEAAKRLLKAPADIAEAAGNPAVQAAALFCSELSMFPERRGEYSPAWFNQGAAMNQPRFTAAKLNMVLKIRLSWRLERFENWADHLRRASLTEQDPWYRYWFGKLTTEFAEFVESQSRGPFGFGRMFSMFSDDDEDDDLDDEDDDDNDFYELGAPFDPDCDCENCRAARRAFKNM